jgi:hypothetical protein
VFPNENRAIGRHFIRARVVCEKLPYQLCQAGIIVWFENHSGSSGLKDSFRLAPYPANHRLPTGEVLQELGGDCACE